MVHFGILAVILIIALANAGILPNVIHGPSSRTTLVGPDGSIITSFQPGGQVIAEDHSVPEGAEPTVVAARTIENEPAQTLVAGQLVAAQPAPVVSIQAAPSTRVLETAPVIAEVGAKTTITENSQTIIHPSPAAKIYYPPVVADGAAVIVAQEGDKQAEPSDAKSAKAESHEERGFTAEAVPIFHSIPIIPAAPFLQIIPVIPGNSRDAIVIRSDNSILQPEA
ncbi:hypothetical protein JTB14_027223 [Gonioctena quinquepunctata]|nr:hypothetical protein JTB14_027223 [Gonioctena quinquepunctata]